MLISLLMRPLFWKKGNDAGAPLFLLGGGECVSGRVGISIHINNMSLFFVKASFSYFAVSVHLNPQII